MSPSISFNSPFMSLSCSPFLSLPGISRHLPSCPSVSLSFVCLAVRPHSPCFHLFPLHVPFSSPSFPFHFPLLSCHVTFCPLQVLAFPFVSSPHFPALVFPRFRKNDVKTQSFSRCSAKGGRKPEPAKSRQGIRAWDPCFATAPRRLFLGKPYVSDVGLGGVGFLSIRHASATWADLIQQGRGCGDLRYSKICIKTKGHHL